MRPNNFSAQNDPPDHATHRPPLKAARYGPSYSRSPRRPNPLKFFQNSDRDARVNNIWLTAAPFTAANQR